MKNFDYWENILRNKNLKEFNNNRIGLLWLKLKSIIRGELIKGFLDFTGYEISAKKQNESFYALFDLLVADVEKSHELLDTYIKKVNNQQIESINSQQLVSELYKLKNFEWGGDYQNSLDKHLVSRHIKIQNPSYEHLMSKFETEIKQAVQGYVLNSWYNYWSGLLIENIFKSHPDILPTVGKIKNVDFFINDIPFDLKVTHLPVEYIKQKRKEKYINIAHAIAYDYAKKTGLSYNRDNDKKKEVENIKKTLQKIKPKTNELENTIKSITNNLNKCVEITFLKKEAKKAKISFDTNAKTNDIHYEIIEKMKDKNDEFCHSMLKKLKDEKIEILKEAQANPKSLARWLYENQQSSPISITLKVKKQKT